MANAVLTAFARRRESVHERAEELNSRQAAIDEVRIGWNSIKALKDNEGWQSLVTVMKPMVETLRSQLIESQLSGEEAAFHRGQLKLLEWISQAPSLAEAHLVAVEQAEEALLVDKDDFVRER